MGTPPIVPAAISKVSSQACWGTAKKPLLEDMDVMVNTPFPLLDTLRSPTVSSSAWMVGTVRVSPSEITAMSPYPVRATETVSSSGSLVPRVSVSKMVFAVVGVNRIWRESVSPG